MISLQTLSKMQAIFSSQHIHITGPISTETGEKRLITIDWYERWIPADLTLLDEAVFALCSEQVAIDTADHVDQLVGKIRELEATRAENERLEKERIERSEKQLVQSRNFLSRHLNISRVPEPSHPETLLDTSE